MSKTVPIAFFVYNRPRHSERALRALSRCADLNLCHLHIYCDGPKKLEHREAVDAARAVVRVWGARLGASVVERDENRGLSRSISETVTDLVASHGRVIVLEDDLVPSPDFLSFMLAGLDAYEGEDRVAQISGSLLIPKMECATDGFFLPLTTTWGWATWKRAWDRFPSIESVNVTELEEDLAFRARFTLDGRSNYLDMLEQRLSGRNDSWGILWWYSVAKDDGLVLYPRRPLIWNGGFDGSGIHCDGNEIYRDDAPTIFSVSCLSKPATLPRAIEVDREALEKIVLNYFSPAARVAKQGILGAILDSIVRQSKAFFGPLRQ